jgi:peptidoglycan/xylan/chitin deacetylase (PgdA/CDA1 family)
MLRNLVKTGAAAAVHWSGVTRWFGKNAPLVLSYHRVVENFALHTRDSLPAMLISTSMLERQLDWIGRRYRFVSLDELASSIQAKKRPAKPFAAVTFDDGYHDVYEHAWPLLKRKGIPAAIFVVTDLVGSTRLQYHDKLYLLLVNAFASKLRGQQQLLEFVRDLGFSLPEAQQFRNGVADYSKTVNSLLAALPQSEIDRLMDLLEQQTGSFAVSLTTHRALTWQEIREMHREGVIIGSHTRTHAVLPNESAEKILDEIEGSRSELARVLGAPIGHFAYPDGRFNPLTIKVLAASCYRFGYTTGWGEDPGHPLLTIPRRVLWEHSCTDPLGRFSPALLDCLINGIFDHGTVYTDRLMPHAAGLSFGI